MTLVTIIITLALVGFLSWLVITFIPMPAIFRSLIVGLLCLFMVLWLLQSFGVPTGFSVKLK